MSHPAGPSSFPIAYGRRYKYHRLVYRARLPKYSWIPRALAAGDHAVRLSEPRYEDVVAKVTIQPGKTAKPAQTMKALPPADPHAAEFNSPVQALMLNPGTYLVRVVLVSSGEGHEEQVKIEASKVAIFQAK
jgi:PEGA domain